jgi:hypothetical protein
MRFISDRTKRISGAMPSSCALACELSAVDFLNAALAGIALHYSFSWFIS